jgi:hypothetical protein
MELVEFDFLCGELRARDDIVTASTIQALVFGIAAPP